MCTVPINTLRHAHKHTAPRISPSDTPSSSGTCRSSNLSRCPFFSLPRILCVLLPGMVRKVRGDASSPRKTIETLFSAFPNCSGGGKGGFWQRLYKYLLSNNTAGSRAPSFGWRICHPRESSAGTREGLWNSPLCICWLSMPPFKLFHRLASHTFHDVPYAGPMEGSGQK